MAVVCFILAAAAGIFAVVDPGKWLGQWKSRRLAETGAPSIVIITLDTTRADRLEPYGARAGVTPNLAALARDGVVMEHAYAAAPQTLPAHATVFTGLNPPEHGVHVNVFNHVPDEVTTLAERARSSGYRTAAFVSTLVLERSFGLDQGFETYDDRTTADGGNADLQRRSARQTVMRAISWLNSRSAGEPFFLWVHLYDAHLPYIEPPGLEREFATDPYQALISSMDRELGRLFRHPRVANRDRVAVVVVADHGESLGEHGEGDHGHLAYDATIRIPWIMRLPGGPRSIRFDPNVGQIDIAPTILGLLPQRVDHATRKVTPDAPRGINLAALLNSPETAARALYHRPLYAEAEWSSFIYGWAKLRSWRIAQWKVIEAPQPELYDVVVDAGETRNIAGNETDRSRKMFGALARYIRSAPQTTRSEHRPDSEMLARLQSLGYVAGGRALQRARPPDPKAMMQVLAALANAADIMRRRPDEALRLTRNVLQRDPWNPRAAELLVSALLSNGKTRDALEEGLRFASKHPDHTSLQLVVAVAETRNGRLDDALLRIDGLLNANPQSLNAHLTKISLLREAGRGHDALDALDEASDSLPQSPRIAVLAVEMIELRRQRIERAEKKLRSIIETAPHVTEAWLLLARIEEARGARGAAIATYEAALRRRPDEPELMARLAMLLSTGEAADPAIEIHLRRAIQVAPRFPADLHVVLAGWLSDRGRFDDARKEIDIVLRAFPSHPDARLNRAVLWLRQGRTIDAERELARLAELSPAAGVADANLAAIAIGRGEWKKAERHARRALRFREASALAWNNLAIALDEQQRNQEALKAYRNALRIEPGYWRARLNLGALLAKLDRNQDALAELRSVLREAPDSPEAHLQLAYVLTELRRDAEARPHYEGFLRLAPESSEAAEVRSFLAR